MKRKTAGKCLLHTLLAALSLLLTLRAFAIQATLTADTHVSAAQPAINAGGLSNVNVGGGVGAGFGLFFLCTLVAVLIAKTPDSFAPGFWGRNALLCRFWWLAFYSVRDGNWTDSFEEVTADLRMFRATNSSAT